MSWLLFIVLHSLVVLIFSIRPGDLRKRIVNGQNAPEGKYMWSVSLKGDIHNENAATGCGASIIDKKWLVTAAHCFLHIEDKTISNLTDPNLWHVRTGARKIKTEYVKNENSAPPSDDGWLDEIDMYLDIKDDKRKRRSKRIKEDNIHLHVDKIVMHPKYSANAIEWDIAMIKLLNPIDDKYIGKSVEIISLPKSSDSRKWPQVGQICVLIGWGCKRKDGPLSDDAQVANLKIQTNVYCEKVYNQGADLNDEHEFCAGTYNSGHGLCDGDSGSGLACIKGSEWILAGVASATHAEKPGKYPALFTRVSYFDSWIHEVMDKR